MKKISRFKFDTLTAYRYNQSNIKFSGIKLKNSVLIDKIITMMYPHDNLISEQVMYGLIQIIHLVLQLQLFFRLIHL